MLFNLIRYIRRWIKGYRRFSKDENNHWLNKPVLDFTADPPSYEELKQQLDNIEKGLEEIDKPEKRGHSNIASEKSENISKALVEGKTKTNRKIYSQNLLKADPPKSPKAVSSLLDPDFHPDFTGIPTIYNDEGFIRSAIIPILSEKSGIEGYNITNVRIRKSDSGMFNIIFDYNHSENSPMHKENFILTRESLNLLVEEYKKEYRLNNRRVLDYNHSMSLLLRYL